MKHETPTITAQPRDRKGSRYAQRLRKGGRLPAVVYGHNEPPVSVSIDEKEILRLLQHGAHAMYLDIEGGGTQTCLVKDLQFGYLGDNVIHVDFTRVDLDEEVEVNVAIDFVGEPEAAQQANAILRQDQSELLIRCKVSDIPDEIRVDLSKMTTEHLTAADIELPPNVQLADPPDMLIASIELMRDEEETGEEAAVEGGGAEPEVITEAKDEGEADKS